MNDFSVQANPFFHQGGSKVKPHLTLTLASTEDQLLESPVHKEDQPKFQDPSQVKISKPAAPFVENKLSKTESEHNFKPPSQGEKVLKLVFGTARCSTPTAGGIVVGP